MIYVSQFTKTQLIRGPPKTHSIYLFAKNKLCRKESYSNTSPGLAQVIWELERVLISLSTRHGLIS